MKVYFVYSRSNERILREMQVRLMFSYAFREKGIVSSLPSGFPEIMIDSGAFQLSSGSSDSYSITLDGYCIWLHQVLVSNPEIVAYLNLDVIRDPAASLDNFHQIEAQGLHPVPVWHMGSGDFYLDYYCSRYEFVAIGGLVNMGLSNMRVTIERLKSRHPDTKFHFLGVGLGAFKIFRGVKAYSVDCSTWTQPGRFGNTIQASIVQGKLEVHTSRMKPEVSARARADKTFVEDLTRQAITSIKLMETAIEDINEPWQLPLM